MRFLFVVCEILAGFRRGLERVGRGRDRSWGCDGGDGGNGTVDFGGEFGCRGGRY